MNDVQTGVTDMGKKILLVDDDTDMLMLTERWLLRADYEVVTATSGDEAIDILKKDMPDVMLLDFSMPGRDGIDTLSEIRDTPEIADVHVFFLTGMEWSDPPEKAELLKPEGYLKKSDGKKPLLWALEQFFL